MGQLENWIQSNVKRFEKLGLINTDGIYVTSNYKHRLDVVTAQNVRHVPMIKWTY